MAFLRADATNPNQFEAVDEGGKVVATGTLEVDIIPGAQRHGTLQFVTDRDWDAIDREQQARIAGRASA